jgi:hypothetical protein
MPITPNPSEPNVYAFNRDKTKNNLKNMLESRFFSVQACDFTNDDGSVIHRDSDNLIIGVDIGDPSEPRTFQWTPEPSGSSQWGWAFIVFKNGLIISGTKYARVDPEDPGQVIIADAVNVRTTSTDIILEVECECWNMYDTYTVVAIGPKS